MLEVQRSSVDSVSSHKTARSIMRFGKETLLYVISDVSTRAVSFLLIPLYARYLGATGYGILSLADTIRSLIYVVPFNCIASLAIRFYPDFDKDDRRSFFGTLWLVLISGSLLLIGGLTIGGPGLFRLILRDLPYDVYGSYVVLSALVGIATMSLPLNLFRASRQPGRYAVFNIGFSVVSLLFIIYFVAIRSEGVIGSLRGQLYAVLVLAPIGVIVAWRRVGLAWIRPYIGKQVSFVLPLIPHFLAAWGLNLSDRIVLNHYVSIDDLGVYTLGYQFGMLLNMIVGSVGNAWGPYYALNARKADKRQEISRLITYMWGIIMAAGLTIVLLAEPVIQMVATPSFFFAARVVPWIVVGYMLLGLGVVPRTVLLMQDKTRYILLTTIIAVFVNLGLNLLLIPRWGIMAAAMSTFVAYLLSFAISVVLVSKPTSVEVEVPRVVKLTIVGILAYGVGTLIVLSSPIATAILRLVYTPLALLLGLWFMRFYNVSEVAIATKIRDSLRSFVSKPFLP